LGLKLIPRFGYVARDSQVQRVANIATELDDVVAFRLGPIVHKLTCCSLSVSGQCKRATPRPSPKLEINAAVNRHRCQYNLADDRITA